MEEMSYIFSFTFSNLLPLIFILHWWPLAFLILSPPLQNFDLVLPTTQKKCLLRFFSLALDLSRPFSRWPSLACSLTFSFSLSFSCSIFQICRHAGQWIQAEYFRQHGYRNNFRFPFSSLLYKTPVIMRFPAKITSSCIWVAIPVELFYIGMPLVWTDGRSGGRCTVTWLPNFLGWVVYFIFLPMVLRWRA